MDTKTAQHVTQILKAMAHPVRLQIVDLLQNREMCVKDITAAVEGKQSITSQQLNMMKDKGLLSCRRKGANVLYRIENENVVRLLDCVNDHCNK